MKKLYIISYVFFLILLSSFVSAITDEDIKVGVVGAWEMEDNGNDEAPAGNTMGLVNNPQFVSDCKIGGCYNFSEATENYLSAPDVPAYTFAQIFSVCAWVNSHDVGTSNPSFISQGDSLGGAEDLFHVGLDGETGRFRFYLQTAVGSGDSLDPTASVEQNWYRVCGTYNTTHRILYVNGTLVDSDIVSGNIINVTINITIAKHTHATFDYLSAMVDQVMIWNRTLNQSEITYDHNSGKGRDYYDVAEEEGATATPTIVAPSPADNAHNNTNVTLQVNHSTTQNDIRYYLYFGTSSTLTESDLYLNNVTRSGDEYRNFSTNVSDGVYYYKWEVQNITDGVFSLNTTQRTWTLDTTLPTITRLTNNNWKTDNTTIISSYLNNLTINISFFDTNLYQVLINITNETNNNVTTLINTSLGGETTKNYSQIIDISGWSLGNYTIKLTATDSHTADSINDYSVIKGINYLRYKTDEGNIIKIKSDTLPLSFSTTKFKDRYDFKFNYLFSKEIYKFRVESYNRINYLPDSDYKAHFVIMGSNGRGNWLDFGNPNLSKKDYKITKIDDYTYEVEITSLGLKNFGFNSIGGLNTKEEHYKIQLAAVLDIQVGDDETGDWINATVTIGSQSANTTVYNQTNITAARLVNITKDITSLTLASSGFGTEEKTISVTEKYHNLSFNMTPVSAAKLYFYDEKSGSLITGETFSVYLETTGFSQTYSGINSTSDNPYTITGLDSGLYKLKASSINYPERQYLDLNISNVTTTNLNIYLINSTLGSEITFNIVSVDGLVPLKDVRTVFTKIINGTRTVIAEENSDFAGQVVLNLDEDTQYTINFSKTNYENQIITLEPKNADYLIQMVSTVGAYNQSVHEGIRYRFEPSNIVLNNNTKYNFTFTLNSTVWDVTGCALYLRNGSTLLDSTSSYTSSSCFLRIEQDTFSMTNITSEVIYQIGSVHNFTVSQQYSVIYTYEGEFSLKNFLDDISDFSMAGFDSFGRMILAFIVIFVILTLASTKISFEHKEIPIFIFWALVGFFSFVGWFTLELNTMPDLFGLKKWFIFYLVSLVCSGFIMNKFRR